MRITEECWKKTDSLDSLFMAAGDRNDKAVSQLADILTAAKPDCMMDWPISLREFWESGTELVLDAWLSAPPTENQTDFLLALGKAHFDSAAYRDLLAAAARRTFNSYLDPAGLLKALGIHKMGIHPAQIIKRWQLFAELAENSACCHPTHGVGVITEIDQMSNDVMVKFERQQHFPLEQVLQQMLLIRPGSELDKLRLGKIPDSKLTASSLRQSVITPSEVDGTDLRKLLVPALLPAVSFDRIFDNAQMIEDAPVVETQPQQQRAWDDSRSLYELVDLLENTESIPAAPQNVDTVAEILRSNAPRRDQVVLFAKAIALLWKLSAEPQWLNALLQELADIGIVWNDSELFTIIADKLPGKLLPSWFKATASAKTPQYLAAACTHLPLRLWTHIEKVLLQLNHGNLLFDSVKQRVLVGDATPDILLWLWKKEPQAFEESVDALLLFRTLEKPAKGSFLKARKSLRKQLLDSAEFQSALMHHGTPDRVTAMIGCIRHLPLLNSGEQQSLLVKIVRLFPEAKSMVEERRDKQARKPIGRISSLRSLQKRQQELQEIVKEKIPANSRAIAHARSYGDLRENAEYKAAKEEQAYLSARRNELEEDLHDIQATDFGDVTINDQVIPGSAITLTFADGSETIYYLLGLWDSVPEKNIISYETPLGKILLGAQVNSSITMPTGETATITALAALPAEIQEWVKGEHTE